MNVHRMGGSKFSLVNSKAAPVLSPASQRGLLLGWPGSRCTVQFHLRLQISELGVQQEQQEAA